MAGKIFTLLLGLDAMSSASAYPLVQIGDGEGNKDIIK